MPSPPTHADPESEFLLLAARTATGPDVEARLLALADHVDWDRLARLARRHHVTPLVVRSLQRTCPAAVPPDTLAVMQDARRDVARRSLLLAVELARLVPLLAAHGVRVLPLKGPALAQAVYGDLYLRETRDLDILLPPDDVPRAIAVLLADGYAPRDHLSAALDGSLLEHGYDYELAHSRRRTLVELHWRFAPAYFSFPLHFEDIWARRQALSLDTVAVPALSPEDLLLVLCVHAIKHLWKYECALGWVCDIAEVIRAYPRLDWGLVASRARALGAARILHAGIVLAVDLLDAPAPAALVNQGRRRPEVRWVVTYAVQRLLGADDSVADGTLRHLFYLKARERRIDRLRYAAHLANAPEARHYRWRLFLPAVVSLCHYASRPIALPFRRVLAAVNTRRRQGAGPCSVSGTERDHRHALR